MIDLHVHTNCSDGKYSAIEVLKMAQRDNISQIAFCDHNVLGAYDELAGVDIRPFYSGRIINGIEFDIAYQGKLFHMLGYKFNISELKKSRYIDRSTEKDILEEQSRNLELLKSVCSRLGIKLTPGLRVTSTNNPANDIIKNDMLSHPENKDILDKLLGKKREISFWRGHVTNPESPFFIDYTRNLPSPQEIADEIHRCGGIVVLPHVFEYKSIDNITFLNEMYSLGILDGVECAHSKHSKEQTDYLIQYAQEKGLIITGGSDFHTEEGQRLGYGNMGTLPVTDDFCFRKTKKVKELDER